MDAVMRELPDKRLADAQGGWMRTRLGVPSHPFLDPAALDSRESIEKVWRWLGERGRQRFSQDATEDGDAFLDSLFRRSKDAVEATLQTWKVDDVPALLAWLQGASLC